MLKPICVPCRRFYRPKKNGFCFIEGMPEGNAAPGNAEPDKWNPYKLWTGDLWECLGCGATIVVGTGHQPIAEHYQPDFEQKVEQHRARQLQVNDC